MRLRDLISDRDRLEHVHLIPNLNLFLVPARAAAGSVQDRDRLEHEPVHLIPTFNLFLVPDHAAAGPVQ